MSTRMTLMYDGLTKLLAEGAEIRKIEHSFLAEFLIENNSYSFVCGVN